jgi:trehalose-phosphatase
MAIPALPVTAALARRLCGRPLVLVLDIDGTLSPIAPRPEYAEVPEPTREVLRDLAALPWAHVIVMTGREAEDARRLVGVDGTWIVGNHGFEIAEPNRRAVPSEHVEPFAQTIAKAVERCRAVALRDSGILVEDKRWTVSIHYRLAHPRIVPELAAQVETIARELGLRVTHGKEVLELRPPVNIDKGTASEDLASTLGALRSGASLVCAGDDRTDEDAFRALRAAQPVCVTVRVGADADQLDTLAEFRVSDTGEMRELLRAVLHLQRDGTTDR